jgi:hypothetical protein
MIAYKWSILEIFGDQKIAKVRYLLKAQDETNIVETEGEHTFLEGTIIKSVSEIKEQDLISALIQDTTQDEINLIKLNLENQLEAIKANKKIAFPWEAETFTIG